MNPSPLLNYYKTILQKVSFDPNLLTKEYDKALRHLQPDEATTLKNWVHSSNLIKKLTISSRKRSMVEVE